jgi:hypothetical protein
MKWGVWGGKGERGKGIVFLIYLDDQKWKGGKGNGMIKG